MLPTTETEITTFLLDENQKERLENLAHEHKTTLSEILRKCLVIFLNDEDFQKRILKEIKKT